MGKGKKAAQTDFELALEFAHSQPERFPQPYCKDEPGPYVDYDYPLPSAEDAADLCEPCPLLLLCAEHARKRRVQWGVWGGGVWVAGRQAQGPHDS